MNATRVDQWLSNEASSPAQLLVSQSSSLSKRRSVTTTMRQRKTLRAAESPLDDLRQKLANYSSSRVGWSSMSASCEPDKVQSAHAKFTSGLERARAPAEPDNRSPRSAPATLSSVTARPDYRLFSASVPADSREKLTSNQQNNDNIINDTTFVPGQLADVLESDSTLPGGQCRAESLVKVHSSSSSSSTSGASSPCNSPLSSRHSSDCGAQAGQQQQQQARSVASSKRESSSSSRTIRRRTVRRSYHTHATEQSNERSSVSPVSRRVLTSGNLLTPRTSENDTGATKHSSSYCQSSSTSERVVREQQQRAAELGNTASHSSATATTTTTSSGAMNQSVSSSMSTTSLFERRNRVAEVEELRSRHNIAEATERESVRRESFNGISASSVAAASAARLATGGAASTTRTTTFGEAQQQQQQERQASRNFSESSSSSFRASSFFADHHLRAVHHHQQRLQQLHGGRQGGRQLLEPLSQESGGALFGGLFSSPDVRHLVHEIGTDFAELESALSRHATRPAGRIGALTAGAQKTLLAFEAPATDQHQGQIDALLDETHSTIKRMQDNPPVELGSSMTSYKDQRCTLSSATAPRQRVEAQSNLANENSERIRALLDRANSCTDETEKAVSEAEARQARLEKVPLAASSALAADNQRQAVMNESIVRIDQRMGDLCAKLKQTDCRDTQKAIDLLKVMIQMVEKAWSVPVCGDDLGFRLCSSLRDAGGLDIVLAFVRSMALVEPTYLLSDSKQTLTPTNGGKKQALKLSLPVPPLQQPNELDEAHKLAVVSTAAEPDDKQSAARDNDSAICTSDLGLDSASVESLPCAPQATSAEAVEQTHASQASAQPKPKVDEEELERVRREELILLSARLVSQCLTSDNRDYIVCSGQLDPVIRLACQLATMKSKQSKRLLKRAALMSRQSSSIKLKSAQSLTNAPANDQTMETEAPSNVTISSHVEQHQKQRQQQAEHEATNLKTADEQQSAIDAHSAIGIEILQHLFKHSEETCSQMISLGALQAILYGCRLSHTDTLRHCASALANLALYGGPDSQQTMIEQKAHVWLFPLAFNEADEVRYYACLAIVVLAANQEIEADVLKSGTLELVEPFVTAHEPRQFAESTTAHIHGQSAGWLRKLVPLLESKREEARNLACFHFAMEAYIKREQDKAGLFNQIGAVEPLRKAASSPIAIASRFACQALRLMGESEPHKLSQQVPLWTCKDVCVWVGQIGFDQFQSAFKESHVDGDLLLQLDEEMLKFDIGLENGIIRRRFMRELAHLKRIADYSSVDRTGLGVVLVQAAAQALEVPTVHHQSNTAHHHQHHLQNHSQVGHHSAPLAPVSINARDFVQYIYPILQLGVTRDNIHLIDCDQLLAECKISNVLHRVKLAASIRGLQDRMLIEAAACEAERQRALAGDLSADQRTLKTLDVFVSYRRSTGSQLASLLKVHLQLRGFSVFIDVERLEAGKFDNNLLDSIKSAKNFILVLSPNALDRCIDDHECKDWVHKEIVAALASNCNIIPIIDNFHWPDPEQLPEDMRSITYFNGVRWIHDYQDACVDKVERFIRGEISNANTVNTAASIISSSSTCSQSLISTTNQQQQQTAGQQSNGGAQSQQQQRPASVAQSNHIPSTPLIFGTSPPTPSICASSRQYLASQQHQTISCAAVTTASTMPLIPHPSESDNHPLAFANYQPYRQFEGSLSIGPSNYRLR